MNVLREERNVRLILDDDEAVQIQVKINKEWQHLMSGGIMISDYIKELLKKIDRLEADIDDIFRTASYYGME